MGCGKSKPQPPSSAARKPDELEHVQGELAPEKQLVSEPVLDNVTVPSDDAEDEEKGYADSKPAKLTAADNKGIPLLAALDDSLVDALTSGAIKLLRAEFLRADGSEAMLPKLLRRQELERLEKERRVRIFLTPEEAVAALRSLRREVAGLTYGWASPDHPDVTGEYLANVRRFLRDPLGEHVTALFWECAAASDPLAPSRLGAGPIGPMHTSLSTKPRPRPCQCTALHPAPTLIHARLALHAPPPQLLLPPAKAANEGRGQALLPSAQGPRRLHLPPLCKPL